MEIRLQDGQVMFESEFRQYAKENGGSVWGLITPEILASFNATAVLEGAQAAPTNHYQYSMRNGVEEIDGVWYTKYILGPVFTDGETTAAEQETAYRAMKDAEQAKNVRTSRDAKLKDCDWTQLADSTADKQAWAIYRQALRDLPTASGFPWNMTWPTQPE